MPAFDLNREKKNQLRRANKIRQLDHSGLIEIWEKSISLQKKKGLTGDEDWDKHFTALEYVVLRAFELEGADVHYPFFVHPLGDTTVLHEIDGAIFGACCKSVLFEFKSWTSKPVNYDPIAKLRSQLLLRPDMGIGCFFSMSGYTTPAIRSTTLAGTEAILLWKRNEIEHCLYNQTFLDFLEQKYQMFFTLLIPDYEPEL